MSIPMVDLKAQVRDLEAELLPAIRDVLSSTRFVLGPNVKALEDEVAAYHGVRHAVGVASGTDALLLSLRAAGVGPGTRSSRRRSRSSRRRRSSLFSGRRRSSPTWKTRR